MDQAERAQTIDALVRGALNLFGDDRDVNSPLAYRLEFGLAGVSEASISYSNVTEAAFLLGAAAYRRRLQSLSDDDLLSELRRAVGFAELAAEGKATALETAVTRNHEALRTLLRQMAQRGGAKPKGAIGIAEACKSLCSAIPDLGPTAAWRRLLDGNYETADGKYRVSGDASVDILRQTETKSGRVTSIKYNTFRQRYWPPRERDK